MNNDYGNKPYNSSKNQPMQNNNSYNKKHEPRKKELDANLKNIINNIKYYDYDEKGEVKEVKVNLFSEEAEKIVNEIAKEALTCNEKNNKDIKNSINQLRRFYNDILMIKNKIEYSQDADLEFKKQLPYIRMIAAKANYACQRDHITMFLNEFIKHNVLNLVNTIDDYYVFCTLFESIIAYSTGVLSKN
ncbi:MAG: type III-A CRISPR-associated protein Csm2 [bacterium]